MSSAPKATFARARAAVGLCRARLRATGGGRAARLGAWSAAIGFGAIAIGLRIADGAGAALEGVIVSAAHVIVWLAGAPLSLAAAEDARAADRRDGIAALVAGRGISPAGLGSARALAAMVEIARAIAVPVGCLAVLTAALAGRIGEAMVRIGLGVGVAMFAIVAGVTLGGVGAASARVGGARGRWVLLAIVLGPFLLADLAGRRAFSIPGALGAALDFALGAWGGA